MIRRNNNDFNYLFGWEGEEKDGIIEKLSLFRWINMMRKKLKNKYDLLKSLKILIFLFFKSKEFKKNIDLLIFIFIYQ